MFLPSTIVSLPAGSTTRGLGWGLIEGVGSTSGLEGFLKDLVLSVWRILMRFWSWVESELSFLKSLARALLALLLRLLLLPWLFKETPSNEAFNWKEESRILSFSTSPVMYYHPQLSARVSPLDTKNPVSQAYSSLKIGHQSFRRTFNYFQVWVHESLLYLALWGYYWLCCSGCYCFHGYLKKRRRMRRSAEKKRRIMSLSTPSVMYYHPTFC